MFPAQRCLGYITGRSAGDLCHGEGGRPLGAKDVQADRAVAVDVRMVDTRGKCELRWLEGVVCGEVDIKEEDASLERRLRRAKDGGLKRQVDIVSKYIIVLLTSSKEAG